MPNKSVDDSTKRKQELKKPRIHPKDADAVSYASDSDQEKVNKAKSSPKRLSFGFADVEDKRSSTRAEPSEKRTRKPSEKVLYMAGNNMSESDTPQSPDKKTSSPRKSSSKDKHGHVSESWSDWSDSDHAKLSKNDRNAAAGMSTPKGQASDVKPRTRAERRSPLFRESEAEHILSPSKRGGEVTPSRNRRLEDDCSSPQRRGTDNDSDFENVTPKAGNRFQHSRENTDSSKKRRQEKLVIDGKKNHSGQSDIEVSTPKGRVRQKRERDMHVSEDKDFTPRDKRTSSGTASSGYRDQEQTTSFKDRVSMPRDKGKQRARSPSPLQSDDVKTRHRRDHHTSSPETETRRPQEHQILSELQPPFKDHAFKNVKYPEMPTACTSFTGFKHLPHTFSLDGRPSNLLSCERFYNSMHEKDKKSFLSALTFTREGSFINPSRSRLNNLNVGKYGRLVFGRDDNALFLFNGAVGYCSLVEPASINGPNVRCISVYPFKDDFVQWKKFFASAIQKSDFITYIDNDVVSFLSRKEHAVDEAGTAKNFSSPKKASKLFDPDSDTAGDNASFHVARIPNSLPYTDKVPIYDARGTNFLLSEEYKEIGNLPLYKSGLEDLPQFAVVSVGHTVSTFSYNAERNLTALQLHVIFVLLHGFVIEEET